MFYKKFIKHYSEGAVVRREVSMTVTAGLIILGLICANCLVFIALKLDARSAISVVLLTSL